jgi:hypothetical protein
MIEISCTTVLYRLKSHLRDESNLDYEVGVLIKQGNSISLIDSHGNSVFKDKGNDLNSYSLVELTKSEYNRFPQVICIESLSWDRSIHKWEDTDIVNFTEGKLYVIAERTFNGVILIDDNFKRTEILYTQDNYHKFKQV